MCCPYFLPERLSSGPNEGTGTLPLGDEWRGACNAAGGVVGPAPWPAAGPPGPSSGPVQPPETAWGPAAGQEFGPRAAHLCNFGYARGECPWFPDGAGPDAVRFAVSRDDGDAIHIRFALERDHHPFAHGCLEYRRSLDGFAAAPPGNLAAQARAYTESYLRRLER